MAIDPICGMSVEEETAAGSHTHEGKTYYFCSTHCLEKFQVSPSKYIKPSGLIDPICEMSVEEETAVGSHTHRG